MHVLVEKDYDRVICARPFKHIIQLEVQDLLAQKVMGGEISERDTTVHITRVDDVLGFETVRGVNPNKEALTTPNPTQSMDRYLKYITECHEAAVNDA